MDLNLSHCYMADQILRPEGIMQGCQTKKLIVSTLALFFLACSSFAAIHEDEPRTTMLGSSDHRAIFGRHGVHDDGNVDFRIPSEALFLGRPLERLLRTAWEGRLSFSAAAEGTLCYST
ncbi:hypothetical protein Droror1_Dr00017232 [Drosera rotundifolia]